MSEFFSNKRTKLFILVALIIAIMNVPVKSDAAADISYIVWTDTYYCIASTFEEMKQWLEDPATETLENGVFKTTYDTYQELGYIYVPVIANQQVTNVQAVSYGKGIIHNFSVPNIMVSVYPLSVKEQQTLDTTDIVVYEKQRNEIELDVEKTEMKLIGDVYENVTYSYIVQEVQMKNGMKKCVLENWQSDSLAREGTINKSLSFLENGMYITISYYEKDDQKIDLSCLETLTFEKVTIASRNAATDNTTKESEDNVTVSKPKSSKIKRLTLKNNKLTVKLRKSKDADGYEVFCSMDKRFSSSKKKVTKNTSIAWKGLKKNKTYYVKVRAFKKANGKKIYSDYSAVTAVTKKNKVIRYKKVKETEPKYKGSYVLQYSGKTDKNETNRIIRTYEELKGLINQYKDGTFAGEKEVIKKLKSYKKSYFKKNVLCFTRVQEGMPYGEIEFVNVKNTFSNRGRLVANVYIKKTFIPEENMAYPTIAGNYFYFVEVAKKDMKDVAQVKFYVESN